MREHLACERAGAKEIRSEKTSWLRRSGEGYRAAFDLYTNRQSEPGLLLYIEPEPGPPPSSRPPLRTTPCRAPAKAQPKHTDPGSPLSSPVDKEEVKPPRSTTEGMRLPGVPRSKPPPPLPCQGLHPGVDPGLRQVTADHHPLPAALLLPSTAEEPTVASSLLPVKVPEEQVAVEVTEEQVAMEVPEE